jgi:hypothetical protein
MPSHWIAVASDTHEDGMRPAVLDREEVDAVTAQVRNLSAVIVERIRTATIRTAYAEAELSGRPMTHSDQNNQPAVQSSPLEPSPAPRTAAPTLPGAANPHPRNS